MRIVFCCIKADFCNQIVVLIFQKFSRSTRFAFFRTFGIPSTAPNSKFSDCCTRLQNLNDFSNFRKISSNSVNSLIRLIITYYNFNTVIFTEIYRNCADLVNICCNIWKITKIAKSHEFGRCKGVRNTYKKNILIF